MNTVLKDVAVALCALAYSAAILGLAALMVLGTPGVPPTAPPPPHAVQAVSAPLPAEARPPAPADRRPDSVSQPVEFRDL